MIKCILIYLWIYIGIYYVIEAAADADEHVHIKLHMPRGQRNTHNNNHHHHHHSHHKKRQLPVHYNSAPLPPREPPQLYHETPHNYLTAITKTTTPQHHLHHLHHTKKLPTSHLHETIGQLLEADDVFSSSTSSEVAETAAAAADTEDGDHMQYLADNFALFPQPSTSTTYETELIPHSNSHSFVAHREEADEEDNEISGPGDGSHDSELIMMEEEEAENYPRHTAYAERFTSPSKTMKNEQQLLQQIYQQQQEQHQQQHNQFEQQADSMKTAKLRGNKYKKAEKEYYSEDDMTANMMMYSSMPHTTTTTMTTFAKGNNAKVDHSDNGGFKTLTVDDIWSQLQRQYLNKYVPQAQPLSDGSFGDGDDGHNEGGEGGEGGDDISLKSTPKRKRTIIRQKPKSSSSSSSANRQPTSSFWPAKSLNYDNNNHQAQNHDDNHSFHSYSTSPTLSSSPYPSTSSRNTELFDDTRAFRRPYNKFNGHNTAAAHHTHVVANEDDDDVRIQFNTDNVDDVDDDNDSSSHHHHHQHRDASSFEENVYQRGKKYVGNTGHVAYGNSNVNNPFNYQDLYGAFSTPITATVATKVHPSTYHPKLTRASTFSSSPSPASFYGDSVSPTLSHESTSYQWHTQQHNPDSYQTYHSHHQKQQQQDTHQQQQHHEEQQHLQHSHPHQNQHHRFHQFQPPQSSALRLPKATITIMPSTASTAISSTFASSLSPTMSNEFTSSPATKTTQQTSRYKKRKNRIKTKKNRIVVV